MRVAAAILGASLLIGLLPAGVIADGTVDAVDDDAILNEDPTPNPWPIDVLANDSSTLPATIVAVSQGSLGTVTIEADGLSVLYAPDPDANGSDSFTYTYDDAMGSSDTATVDVTIVAQNDAPSGSGTTVQTGVDTPYVFDVADFGFSDSHDAPPDGFLAVRIVTLPASGQLADDGVPVIADGAVTAAAILADKLTFTPDSGESGSPYASFTFRVRDDGGTPGIDLDPVARTMTIDVTDTNQDPVANDDDLTVDEDDGATAVPVLANDSDPDGDPLTITARTNGAKGTVVITGGGSGLTYDPAADANGPDSFTYTISDGHGGTAVGTVDVTITPVPDGPRARNDVDMVVQENAGPTALDVLLNDGDADGDSLSIIATTAPSHGTVAITGGGTGLTYNPKQLYHGKDGFTYTISDGHGGVDTALVVVTVVRDTTKPVAIAPAERFTKQTVGGGTSKVRLTWSGSDVGGTGVARFKLQARLGSGPWQTVALPGKATTTIKRTLADGRAYRFRVRAYDKEGNASPYAYGPTIKAVRIQDSASALTYSGTWGTKKTRRASGGSVHYATSTSASVSISRVVRDLAWVARKTPTAGSAEVWLDGSLAATIDLRAASIRDRRIVYQVHFASLGSHALEIRPIGGGRVYVDAVMLVR